MSFLNTDTIVALATAPLSAGVAVIRLSGANAFGIAKQLCPTFNPDKERYIHLGKIFSKDGDLLDEPLLVSFKNPHSFTGEDVVEIHCHGGKAVVQGIIDELLNRHDHVRHADAGEFSRRAFINGKMDLTEAEGLCDLIDAETQEQKNQALKQMQGELGKRFETWRTEIMGLLAHVEASLDFPDEELEILEEAGLKEKLEALINTLTKAVENNTGHRLRDGFQVVISGKPNVGKSTLTNLLTGKETAIVSPIAGTTRDVVESHLNIGGFPVILADTAGLRDTSDEIEKEGVKRAISKVEDADFIIAVCQSNDWPNLDKETIKYMGTKNGLVIISKIDQYSNSDIPANTNINGKNYPVMGLNLTDEKNIDTLVNILQKHIETCFGGVRNAAQLTRERHKKSVHQALEHLTRAKQLYTEQNSAISLSDLLAQDFRDAAKCIGDVTGKTGSEDVLDLVFTTFCIGK
jgi:tRNA modification GTPase